MFLPLTFSSRLRLNGSLFLCALLLALGTGSGETFADEPVPLVKVLVTYHSLSGNTERMAEAVVDGVKSVSGAEALLKRVGKVTADDLFSADAVVVGSPVYWSNMSGEVKIFFDNWQFKFGVFPRIQDEEQDRRGLRHGWSGVEREGSDDVDDSCRDAGESDDRRQWRWGLRRICHHGR